METVLKVKALSKFGFFVEGEEKGIYFDRQLLEADRGKFVPGASIPVILRVADSGTKYVMSINTSAAPKIVAPVFNNTPVVEHPGIAEMTKLMKTTSSNIMSKADWNAKDRSMMIGGLAHDAAVLAAAAATANVEIGVLLNDYEAALKAMLLIREELK